jgi:hypothetical protein
VILKKTTFLIFEKLKLVIKTVYQTKTDINNTQKRSPSSKIDILFITTEARSVAIDIILHVR